MPHWEYHALLPSGNQPLQRQWDKASYDIHRRKVKTTEATINTAAPRTFGHVALKSKQLEKEQALKIEKDNTMLFEKIAHIKRSNGPVHSDSHERKSLSGERRRQEMLRLTKENQVLLARLGQCRSFYSVEAWHAEWLKTLRVMESITQYPPRIKGVVEGPEKPNKRHSEERTNGDASIHHSEKRSMNNKTKAEEEHKNKEPE